jgi:hypothetical protein
MENLAENQDCPTDPQAPATLVQVGWECRHCGDVFQKPKFRFDYDYQQMAGVCPCCGEWL